MRPEDLENQFNTFLDNADRQDAEAAAGQQKAPGGRQPEAPSVAADDGLQTSSVDGFFDVFEAATEDGALPEDSADADAPGAADDDGTQSRQTPDSFFSDFEWD